MKFKAIYLVSSIFLASNMAIAQEEIELVQEETTSITICGNRAQGQILIGKSENIEKISLDGKNVEIAPNGMFMLAFERDDKLNHTIETTDFFGNSKVYDFPISKTKWDIQDIKGIEQKKVEPSKTELSEIQRERTSMKNSMSKNSDKVYWQSKFKQPVEGRISGNFGGQRIMNGKKMNPHQGMDIAAPRGTAVAAPADGIITLSGNNNFFYSGNVIVIDHGYELFTIYAHLNNTKSKVGDFVKKGEIIGEVGSTGRSTGPHLHWGGSLRNVRFDTKSLMKMHDNCQKLK